LITVTSETAVDWDETARLAGEAFAPPVVFDPARLRWVWESCFAEGAVVLALRADGAKVGQLVILRHRLRVAGRDEPAGLLVDLFVAKAHRSRAAVAALFAEAEHRFRELGLRYAVGMPNRRSLPLNVDLFAMRTVATLPLHMGLALRRPDAGVTSHRVADLSEAARRDLLAPFAPPGDDTGVPWDGAGLARRIGGPGHDYGLHLLPDVAAISSPRRSRGIDHTSICAFLQRDGARAMHADLVRLTRAACALWRRPIFAWCGFDRRLPRAPGLRLPTILRPSPLVVQLRDFSGGALPSLDRYQLIDSDFA